MKKKIPAATMINSPSISRYTSFLLCACVLWNIAFPSYAQNATPDQEYGRYLTAAQTITPVAEFGEQVSLRDGALSFRQVDFELPGIGPTIRFVRTFSLIGRIGSGGYSETSGNRIGEWEIVIPRLKTLTSNKTTGVTPSSPRGWQVGAASNARCTQMDVPGTIVPTNINVNPFEYETWWAGYQLVDDLGIESNVLAHSSTTGMPSHVARTKENWLISCLPSTANGEPGEAFQATSPDGTRYWLNYLVYRSAPSVGASGAGYLARRYASMLVTRIEDRFGNWVTYQYTAGILNSISASDGRQVTISNNGAGTTSVTSVSTSGSRTWQYQSSGYTLSSIILPDGSSWNFSLANLWSLGMPLQNSGNCYGPTQRDGLTDSVRSGTITAPAGATATFNVRVLHSGRSYVPRGCWSQFPSDELFAEIPKDTWAYAITSKTVTGPGVVPATWSYSYSPGNSSWSSDCGGGCASSVWTDVTEPDGVRQRSIFSNKFGGDEGLLLREETYASGNGALVRAVDHAYAILPADETNSPYPWRSVGFDFTPRSNWQVSERWTPAQSTTVTQDGRSFQRVVNSYDTYARPLSVTKSSAPSP